MATPKENVNFLYHQEFGGLEMVNAQYRKKNFRKHCHESYTVSVIKTGVQKFFRSGADHFAPEHSIILVNADDVHTGQAADGVGWSYQAVYPLESHFNQLAADIGWSDKFAPYFSQPVVFDPELARALRRVFCCLEFGHNKLQRETLLNNTLTELMIRYGCNKPPEIKPMKNFAGLARAREQLLAQIGDNLSLKQLSETAGMSPFHFVRQFKKYFGLPPHAYQLQQRLRLSKRYLRSGTSVITTCHELGFHDQSHFHRYFKSAMGISPSQYQQVVNQ